MSIFERKLVRKVSLDDSYSLKASIINSETTQGHTEYVIKVKRNVQPENSWFVRRRYNDFLSLHHSLQPSGINLPLPPKKIIGNMNRNFIAERQIALQNYLDIVLNHPLLSSQLVVKKFLDPHNYHAFRELGLSAITIGLRGEVDIKIVKQLPQIGTRLRKEYYLVKMKSDPKQEMILSWLPFGPDNPHDPQQIVSLLKVLTTLQHVNVVTLIKAGVCNDGAWVIREIRKTGSILDTICGITKPSWNEQALKKYANYELRKPIPPEKIIDIVTQILQALAFFHYKGIPYGHLHIGNIVYEEGLVKLLDIENGMVGVSYLYRPLLTRVKQITSMQSLDVYCLGLAMFEMATGIPFTSQKDFTDVPEQLRPVIVSILSAKSGRSGLPTVADLLNIDLFRQAAATPQPHVRLTTSAKKDFGTCAAKTIERIKEDYSRYRQEKRVLKVYEYLDESEGQILLCYKKKSKNPSGEDDINGNIPLERSASPSSTNSNINTTLSALSGQVSVSLPTDSTSDRRALLGAICTFNKDSLKKTNGPHCV